MNTHFITGFIIKRVFGARQRLVFSVVVVFMSEINIAAQPRFISCPVVTRGITAEKIPIKQQNLQMLTSSVVTFYCASCLFFLYLSIYKSVEEQSGLAGFNERHVLAVLF